MEPVLPMPLGFQASEIGRLGENLEAILRFDPEVYREGHAEGTLG